MTLDGWWFAKRDADGEVRLPHGDGRVVRVGETLTVDGPPVLCQQGLHASVHALDALAYAPGPIVCRVRLSGKIMEGKDKACATERTVLAMADVERDLRIYALGLALAALRAERAAGREPDPRSWAAIETTIAWMEGRARAAARDAARAAAWAAASDATWAAARDAAWAAAWAAARDAASAAAWAAAWAAASDAAWDAAWAAANRILEDLLCAALRGEGE
jgi:hypothetical protein